MPKCPNREGRLAEKKKKKRKKKKEKSGDGNVGRRNPHRGFWHEAGHAGDKRSLS